MSDFQAEKVAVLENELKHIKSNHQKLEVKFEEVIKVVKQNNDIIQKSKGIAYGASLVVSGLWMIALAVYNYIIK